MTKHRGKRGGSKGHDASRPAAKAAPALRRERRERPGLQLAILLGSSLVLLVLGWRLFWFLTDDAFISFRYISNSLFGYGYVWNPPPFQPIEGYTNFLWILILDGVWRVFQVPPPVSANYLSLVLSFVTIVVLVLMMLRMEWHARLRSHRYHLVGLAVLFLLVNRSFLAWTSSGLETALLTCLIALWSFCALSHGWGFRRRAVSTTLAAALMALTRPDGLLYVGASIVLLGIVMAKRRREIGVVDWIALSPLLVVPAHEAWRLAFYGEWLPNSYYAKLVAAWPASGALYALSFIMEYALWAWIALVVVAALRGESRAAIRRDIDLPRIIVVGAMLCNFLYYTFVVGGDHFEYRVYNHILIFVPVTFLWFLNRLALEWRRTAAAMAAFVVLSLPVPWTHWALTHNLNTRVLTFKMSVPVAERWPLPVRWYGRLFDAMQFKLIDHSVCMRHQEHKICYEYLCERNPAREEGIRIGSEGYPIHTAAAVGVVSWVMPHIYILDILGLNDFVIARMPLVEGAEREMAHDRHAPQNYIACFGPNVFVEDRRIIVKERKEPLTAEKIQTCERDWRAIAKRIEEKKTHVILRSRRGKG